MKDLKPKSRRAGGAAVDWKEVKRRLLSASAAFDAALAPPPEERRKILRSRARELAQEAGEERAAGETVEVVELLLAGERYGIEASYVREVYPLKEVTKLPGTPPFVLGITNVRGRIVAVNDLRRFFGLPETPLAASSKLVILHRGEMEFGALADDIAGVRSLPLAEVQPPMTTHAGGAAYLRGITVERMALLDAEKILTDKRIVIDEEA